MSTPEPDPADKAAADEDLFDLVVTSTANGVEQLRDAFLQLQGNPDTWPRLAATLQWFGQQLAEHGATLADRLAAHAEAYPHITVPTGGVPVLLIGEDDHLDLWHAAAERTPHDDPDGDDYAAAAAEQYGRGQLHGRPASLVTHGAVAVLLHLPAQPDQVVQVVAGGLDDPGGHTDPDTASSDYQALVQLLQAEGLTAGPPVFLPPPHPEATFLSLQGADHLYDAYGRHLADDSTAPPGEPAAPHLPTNG